MPPKEKEKQFLSPKTRRPFGAIIVNGEVIEGMRLQTYARRNGLCDLCGETKTHLKKQKLLGSEFIPLTEKDASGRYVVYKGVCIQPRCYTLEEAKRELGEPPEKKNSGQRRHNHRRRNTPESAELRTSDNHSHGSSSMDDVPKKRANGSTGDTHRRPDTDRRPDNDTISRHTEKAPNLKGPEPRGSINSSNSDPGDIVFEQPPSPREASKPLRRKSLDSDTSSFAPIPLERIDRPAFPKDFPKPNKTDTPYVAGKEQDRPAPSNRPGPPQPHDNEDPEIASRPLRGRDSTNPRSSALRSSAISIVLEDLDQLAQEGDFIQFFATLGREVKDADVVVYGLEILRTSIHKKHTTSPSINYVFTGDAWVKHIKSYVSQHPQNSAVHAQLVLTFWVLGAQHAGYKADVLKYHGAKEVLKILALFPEDEQVKETCAGCIELFTRNSEKIGIRRGSEVAVQTIKRLLCIISSPGPAGKDWAIRALHNLATQPEPTRENQTFVEYFRDADKEGAAVEKIVSFLKTEPLYSALADAGLRLLWILYTPVDNRTFVVASEVLVNVVAKVMAAFPENGSVQHAACGLISCMATLSDEDSVFPSSWADLLAGKMLDAMEACQNDYNVELIGVSAICVLAFATFGQEASDTNRLISVLVATMEKHKEMLQIQTFGTLSLSYMSSASEYSKVAIASSGAIKIVSLAFRRFCNDQGEDAGLSTLLFLGSFTLMASLAVNRGTAAKLQENIYLADFIKVLQNTETGLAPMVRSNLLQLVASSDTMAPMTSLASHESTSSLVNVLFQTERLDELLPLLESFYASVSRSKGAVDALLVADRGRGAAQVVALMKSHMNSKEVQGMCCGILAQIYATIAFEGTFNQETEIPMGKSRSRVLTHSVEEVRTIRKALRTYKADPTTAARACQAIVNFVSGLSANPILEEFRPPEELCQAFDNSIRETVDVISIHESDKDLNRVCLLAFRCSIYLADDVELRRWCPMLLEKIITAMSKFRGDVEIQSNACLVLLTILEEVEDDASVATAGGRDCIASIVANLGLDNEESLVTLASECLSLVAKRVLTAVGVIIDGNTSIEVIVGCMFRFPWCAEIQVNCSSILSTLAVMGDTYVMPMIVVSGGVSAILNALTNHRKHPEVLAYGSNALSSISRGIHSDMVQQMRDNFGNTVLICLESHLRNERIETPVLEILWFLCAKDSYFQGYFSDRNAIPLIIEVMGNHIQNLQLQRAACSCLWTLSCHGDNKQIIGESGGLRALVNTVLYHIDAQLLQKEALTAMKNLATTSANKQAISQFGGEEAITFSMWVNMDNAEVLASAYSALNNVCVDIQNRRVSSISDQTLSCVLVGMRRYPQLVNVQKNACFLLKSLSFSSHNLRLMEEKRTEMMDVLTVAGCTFPDDCGERVQHILRSL